MVDFVPQHYDRAEMDALIASVPVDIVAEGGMWGTPARIVSRLRDLGEAGLRHVVLAPLGALISKRAAVDSMRALVTITRRLRSGR